MEHQYPPCNAHPVPYPPKTSLIKSTLFHVHKLFARGFLFTFSFLVAHYAFVCLARLLPGLDATDDYLTTPFRSTYHIGTFVAYVFPIPLVLSYVVPFLARYKDCVAAGNHGPADDLRKEWTLGFWTADVRRVAGHVWTVALCVGFAYVAGAADVGRKVLDPLHAGIAGAVARPIYLALLSVLLGREASDDDDDAGHIEGLRSRYSSDVMYLRSAGRMSRTPLEVV